MCADDEVVIIQEAFYGRMDLGRCVTTDFGFIGCKSDVLNVSFISRGICLQNDCQHAVVALDLHLVSKETHKKFIGFPVTK